MHKEGETLVEGTLASLKPCAMQISRPRQVPARFITPSMQYAAHEYHSAPSAAPSAPDDYYATHDPMSLVGLESPAFSAGIPVPSALFMPFSQPSQASQQTKRYDGVARCPPACLAYPSWLPCDRVGKQRRPKEADVNAPLSQASGTGSSQLSQYFPGLSQDSFVGDMPF